MRWFDEGSYWCDPELRPEYVRLAAARRRLDVYTTGDVVPMGKFWIPPDIRDDIATLAKFVDEEMDF